MSVNIPNGSSWYFYSQLFRALPGQPTVCPFISRRGIWAAVGGGGMLNFVLMLTSAFHQNHFLLGGEEEEEEVEVSESHVLHNFSDIFTLCCDNVLRQAAVDSCPRPQPGPHVLSGPPDQRRDSHHIISACATNRTGCIHTICKFLWDMFYIFTFPMEMWSQAVFSVVSQAHAAALWFYVCTFLLV